MAKAQGLSLNVVIIAVLGLAVLFILITMLVTKSKSVGEADTCEGAGGECISKEKSCSDEKGDEWKKWPLKKCQDDKARENICCLKIEG